ncbi:hypothetical protein [Nostoc cycadae]|uniref:Uncharacterized protein n=1 Tax=Nostoc cycadae WK-1 TaxID=1861711 RepID=A0A2H6LHH5_9NOSO|nr:hypothetical protein [Nostoc cycadae]GBE92659.1 hypothetical protein NCWK1_2415 [Nostoc cycadae WK-1]
MPISFEKIIFLNKQMYNILKPKAGEIWKVNYLIQSPLNFASEEQYSLYSSLARSFLIGNSPPRYVMIVKEPELSEDVDEQWLIVYVMLLSVEIDFISNIDLLIPAKISGLDQDLLAETWHIIPALACNLLQPVGKRISHHIYDYLLTVSDYYQGLISQLPIIEEIQQLGCKHEKLRSANNPIIQEFHQAEQAWSDVLTVPVAAYYTYLKSIKFTNAILNEALQLEQDLQSDIGD